MYNKAHWTLIPAWWRSRSGTGSSSLSASTSGSSPASQHSSCFIKGHVTIDYDCLTMDIHLQYLKCNVRFFLNNLREWMNEITSRILWKCNEQIFCLFFLCFEPTGPMFFVFCRLGPTPTLHVIALLLTNTVSPVQACLIIRWEGFRGTQKRRSWASQYVFNPLCFEPIVFGMFVRY